MRVTRYVRLKGNIVAEVRDSLPTEFGNMTGFHLLSQEEHEKHGWHEVTSIVPDADLATQVVGEVTASYHPKRGFSLARDVRPMTEEEQEKSDDAFNAVQKQARAEAMAAEADPLFMKFQRGEAKRSEWIDKVADIRARFPYRGE